MKLEIKMALHKKVEELLNHKIQTLRYEIASAKESRDSDTKSSVGDKYETSRAMMHIEIGKNESQLSSTLKLKNEVSHIRVDIKSEAVGFGSVVIANNGKYYVSVALGKLNVQGESYYSISLASPLGKALQGKKAGEVIVFQGKEIVIEDVF